MSEITRHLLVPFATGVLLGWFLLGLFYLRDPFSLASLSVHGGDGWIALAMLAVTVGGTVGICFAATGHALDAADE